VQRCAFSFLASIEQAQEAEKKKPSHRFVQGLFGSGERGIRTPGGVTLNGFQDRRIRPLCHLSYWGANINRFNHKIKNAAQKARHLCSNEKVLLFHLFKINVFYIIRGVL
jgi:hypothetical protein